MNDQQNHLELIENYVTAYNNFDIDGMLRNLHENLYFENIYNGQVNLQTRGIAEFKTQAESAKQLFRQREQKILNSKFDGNTAEVKIAFTGTLSNDPANGSLAGATLDMIGDSVFVFEEGRIIRIADRS